jgi:transposase
MKVTLIGIDLAKNIFQICGVNQAGKPVFNKAIKRAKLMEALAQYPTIPIAMEACGGSNFFGRELAKCGHEIKIIPPIHVKPFVKGNKNDRNDAFAITEAANRPNMQFVRPKTLEQTDLIQVHRLLDRRIGHRTDLMNQVRGFLSEYGIVLAKGKANLFTALPALCDDMNNGLTGDAKTLFMDIFHEWRLQDNAIKQLELKIKSQATTNETTIRLMTLKGVAHKTATAFNAVVGDGTAFRNGRHCSAFLGLVPKESSSGGKQKLGGITHRGNNYLRWLLNQGAWSIVRDAHKGKDQLSRWADSLIQRRGKHKAVMAVANKMARILWAMSFNQTSFKVVEP